MATSYTEALVDHTSSGENIWGILGGDEGNSFLEPVPEDVGPQRRQGHGNQAKEPHEASWG